MPIYFLKRYHRLVPSDVRMWSLGRETAYLASDDNEAISLAEIQLKSDISPFGTLNVLTDAQGNRLWDSISTPSTAEMRTTA